MLAHKAMVDGRVAAENACGGSRIVDYQSVPSVVFTRPEVASVGLTEAQARQQGADVKVAQFPFSANPRAQILGETDGLVKLVCDADRGAVLGVHLLGPHVTDLIAEGALAVQLGATADDLAWTTHAHPTLPEVMKEAALAVSLLGAKTILPIHCGTIPQLKGTPEELAARVDAGVQVVRWAPGDVYLA